MAEQTTTTSISLDKTVLELGRAMARKERRSFSAHATKVLESDLVVAGWLTENGQLTDVGRSMLAAAPKEETA